MRWTVLVLVLWVSGMGCAASTAPSGGSIGRAGQTRVRVDSRTGTQEIDLLWDDETRRSDVTLDQGAAWSRLPTLLAELGLSVGFVSGESLRIGHQGGPVRRIDGRRLSTYLDCGFGTTAQPYANFYLVTLAYEVQLIRTEVEGRARAEMRVEASAKPRDVSAAGVRCRSKGTLERIVFERLLATIATENSLRLSDGWTS